VDLLLQDMAFREEIGVATFESRRARLHVARALRLMWDKGVLDGASVTAILDTKYVDGRQLLNTLRAYIEGGGRIQHVAQALHLHPNTLRQRLRRIESVTGFSLNDPDERLLLELQYRAYIENETR
jgi:DNA-binding PucR family transcriptional regulator